MSETLDLATWPEVPEEERPRPLYVDRYLPPEMAEIIEERGWHVIDIRLLEPQKSLRAKLEGIRLGSIPSTVNERLKYAEIEARVMGLVGQKGQEETESSVKKRKTTIELLNEFGDNEEQTQVEGAFKPERRKGRMPKKLKEMLDD